MISLRGVRADRPTLMGRWRYVLSVLSAPQHTADEQQASYFFYCHYHYHIFFPFDTKDNVVLVQDSPLDRIVVYCIAN
jgi:hypothetical protein